MSKFPYLTVATIAISGCIPTLSQIRSNCEQRYGYNTSRYNDCVSDGQIDAENKRAAIMTMGEDFARGLREGHKKNNDVSCSRQGNIVYCSDGTTCNIIGNTVYCN